ncbi:MAG TPA: hypothetical protein VML55_06830, partial [Planctomycetaceae bacterium]|nr:hypothetical protein [Planctomycetaceae bacterium]
MICEVSWIRKASLVFGSTTQAVSTVLAVFFGGLALGSYVFGTRSGRMANPLKVYGLLETGVGLLALASPLTFAALDAVYGWLAPGVHRSAVGSALVRTALVSAAVLPATVLMGGTLPLFCRQFVSSESRVTRSVGFLYGLNTLGAAAGCAVGGLLLIRWIGVNGSLYVAGFVSLGVGVILLRSRLAPPAISEGHESLPEGRSAGAPAAARLRLVVSALFFLCGFVALGNEVLWTRFLSLLVYGTVETYTLTLTLVLVGIVLGSFLVARCFDGVERHALAFGAVQAATGLAVLAALMLPWRWWAAWMSLPGGLSELGIVATVLLPAAILSGMSFPLAVRMVVDRASTVGVRVGQMAAFNTCGGIAGALVVGFVALPGFGMHTTLLLTTGLSLLTATAAWLLLEQRVSKLARGLLVLACAAIWLAIPSVTGTRLPADLLAHDRDLVAWREGVGSHIAVIRVGGRLQLEMDQLWQGGEGTFHQRLAAHVPALLHADPRHVLVIGLGTGQTASRFLMHGVERLECVDIEPELVGVLREHFPSPWMDDPRVALIVDDGRRYLAHASSTYDVISVEVGQVFRRGVAAFYTAEFYRVARSRLNSGGLICQFVPLAFFDAQEFRAVVATFRAEFPESVLWYNTSELLLIGSESGPVRLGAKRFEAIEQNASVRRDLTVAFWRIDQTLDRPEVFLAGYLSGPAGLASISQGARLCRDDRPFLEFAAKRRLGPPTAADLASQLQRQIELTELIRKHL